MMFVEEVGVGSVHGEVEVSELGQRMLSPETTTKRTVLRDPEMSPNGRYVAFTAAQAARRDEHARAGIYLLDTESGECRRVTHGSRADTCPAWSPDGTRLAFLSDREEPDINALYTLSLTGGEAVTLARHPGGIRAFRWSPDGTQIAFVATDATTDDERKDKKELRDHRIRDANFKYGRLYVVDDTGGESRLVGPEGKGHVLDFDWMPGARIVALLVPGPTADAEGSGPSEFVLYDPGNPGPPNHVLRVATGVGQVRVSPDGREIAFRSRAGRVTDDHQIWVMSTGGGTPRLLTAGYEGTVEEIRWAPDGSEVRYIGFEDVWGVVGAVRLDGEGPRDLLPEMQRRCGTFEPHLAQNAAGDRLAVVRQSSTEPMELWAGSVAHGLTCRTALNADLAEYPYSPYERHVWTSDEGVEIHGLLYRPVKFDPHRRYPMVVHVHGGPAWLWSDRMYADWHDWAQLLAQRGYVVLLPNPRGSTGRGAAFTDANVGDLGGGEFRDMMAGVDHVVALGFVDEERIGIGGWSWGGYMTAWSITQTDRFRCAVMGAGLANLASDQGQNDVPRMNDEYFGVSVYDDIAPYIAVSAISAMSGAATPTLILHGESDERVAVQQSWEMYRGLTRRGVQTSLVTYPREPHEIRERAHQIDLLERVLGWFDRFLTPDRIVRRDEVDSLAVAK